MKTPEERQEIIDNFKNNYLARKNNIPSMEDKLSKQESNLEEKSAKRKNFE